MEKLSGVEINSVTPHYENIIVNTCDKNQKFHNYFISSDELVKILSEFEFIIEKKRTREWLHIKIDDWRIEKFDEPRTY